MRLRTWSSFFVKETLPLTTSCSSSFVPYLRTVLARVADPKETSINLAALSSVIIFSRQVFFENLIVFLSHTMTGGNYRANRAAVNRRSSSLR